MAEGLKSSLEVNFSSPPPPNWISPSPTAIHKRLAFSAGRQNPQCRFLLEVGAQPIFLFRGLAKERLFHPDAGLGTAPAVFFGWIRLASEVELATRQLRNRFQDLHGHQLWIRLLVPSPSLKQIAFCNGYSKYLFIPRLPGCEGSEPLG